MSKFKFELNSKIKIEISGEHGEVIGRAEYTTAEPSYFVRYVTADGRAVEQWWTESSIVLA